MKEYVKSTRPLASSFSGLLLLAAFKVAIGSLHGAWGLAGAMVIISCATMVQNDLRDRWHDARKGKVFALQHEQQFKLFAVFLWVAAIVCALRASGGNTGYGCLLGAAIISGLLYSEMHAIPMLPNTVVAIACGLPALFPLFAHSRAPFACWPLFAGISMAIFGREMLKDHDDRAIDKGYKWTLLERIGVERAFFVTVILFVAASVAMSLSILMAMPFLVFFVPLIPAIEALCRALESGGASTDRDVASAKLLMDIGLTVFLLILVFCPGANIAQPWMAFLVELVGGMVVAYLIGGIPFCWLAVWWFGPRDKDGKRQDLRLLGSGNVGATNAMRQLGIGWYLPLIALDASKAVGAMAIGHWLAPHNGSVALMFGIIAVIGHCFPIYLSFKRGKGISCTIGLLAASGHPTLLAIFLGVWLLAVTFTRLFGQKFDQRVWMSSMSAAASVPIGAWTLTRNEAMTSILATLAVLVILRHSDHFLVQREWQLPPLDMFSLFERVCDKLWGKVE